MEIKRLNNKIALITGGAQGIGEATARHFVKEGAKVVLLDRLPEPLSKLKEELLDNCLTYAVDITDKEAVHNIIKEVVTKLGRIDILINNAGITRDSMTHKMTENDWDLVMDINLKAPFMITQAVFPIMKEQQSGVILNASSVSSLGNIGQANYAATKAGIIAMTKTWALEFARYNIRVNAVAPGFTETNLVKTIPEEIKTKILAEVPLKRFATPNEIAYAYGFLAGDEAKFITGQVLFVDGGLTCGI